MQEISWRSEKVRNDYVTQRPSGSVRRPSYGHAEEKDPKRPECEDKRVITIFKLSIRPCLRDVICVYYGLLFSDGKIVSRLKKQNPEEKKG